jgi:hypothetical protein
MSYVFYLYVVMNLTADKYGILIGINKMILSTQPNGNGDLGGWEKGDLISHALTGAGLC